MIKNAKYRIWSRFFLLLPLLAASIFVGKSEPSVGTESLELELIQLVNLERISRGIPPLAQNESLTDSARSHNQDMIVNDFIAHQGTDGSYPPDRACAHGYMPYGWGDCYVGENINAGNFSPALVLDAWMDSDGHRENLLSEKYREVGVGHATGGRYGNYWTMDLGSQPLVLPVFINADAPSTVSREVVLTLTDEQVSGYGSIGPITGVRASEDSTFANVPWQDWSPLIPFTLSTFNEIKTVYVQFTDGAIYATGADSIELDLDPQLSVIPDRVVFLVEIGSDRMIPSTGRIEVSNPGGDTLDWQAGGNEPWIMLDQQDGFTPSTVQLSIDTELLDLSAPVSLQSTLAFTTTHPDVDDKWQLVPVEVKVVEKIYVRYFPLLTR